MASKVEDSWCDWRVQIYHCHYSNLWRIFFCIMSTMCFTVAAIGIYILYRKICVNGGRFFNVIEGWKQPRPFECFILWMTVSCLGHGIYGVLILVDVLKSEANKEFWQSWPWNAAQVAVVLYFFGILHATPALDIKSTASTEPQALPSSRTMSILTTLFTAVPAAVLTLLSVLSGFARDQKWTHAQDALLILTLTVWALVCIATALAVGYSGSRLINLIKSAIPLLPSSSTQIRLTRTARKVYLLTGWIVIKLCIYAAALLLFAGFRERILENAPLSIFLAGCWWLCLPSGLLVVFIVALVVSHQTHRVSDSSSSFKFPFDMQSQPASDPS
ncbi:uncharacterized protein SPPG_05655 [Spizellomyces punctatus DAOM BR117]|uniref:Uncharacterized protein n=1 Tax=Spizellomyces punctatus (strain DAOM BR117) TaxID=645134 RepID=A0A0L0HEK7_SPIPD|nr:uncharacterized protein SPPG_05655 [Spizellomyces punctatus DAOM BR117]KNC99414.1 hypothetical protein SPPG_05655 [Spizellomyces punctatus DAOM BR117]|eukprot:XP_016607454.1 hypothetical protein SPPG_05655 [Spizellomyces punctatus DAOM BR117]